MNLKGFKQSVHSIMASWLVMILAASAAWAQSLGGGERPAPHRMDLSRILTRTSAFTRYVDPVGGTRVEELVQRALARNADLLAIRQQAIVAQGLLRQARFRPNPELEVSGTTGAFLNSPDEHERSLGYVQPFELGGKRARRLGVAQLGAEWAHLAIADRERLLRAEIHARYGEALTAARNLEIAERLLELNQQSYQMTVAQVHEGEAAPLEQGLLQVEVNRLEADRLLFENQVTRTILELKTLAGMNLDEPLQLIGTLTTPPVPLSLADVLTRALRERSDLNAARVDEQLGEAEVRLARSEAVPNLIGFGRYTRISSRFDQFGLNGTGARVPIRDTDQLLTVGVSLTLPFLNRNQGNIDATLARREAARLRRQFIESVVQREVQAAYSRYETTRRALELFDQRIIGQSQENLRVIRAMYSLGELRLLDVINEQRRVIETQKAYTEVLKEYYLAFVELERAVGVPLR